MYLAVDLGSTSFKARVVGADLSPVAEAGVPVEHDFAPGGVVELAVGGTDAAFGRLLDDILDEIDPEQLRAVAVTSQAQTFTVLDADGAPRTPFMSWQDTRAAEATAETLAAFPDFENHCSFCEPISGLRICLLRHLHTMTPEILAADGRIVSLPERFVEWLTGRFVADDTLAAMSGIYSLAGRDWWDEALDFCGVVRGMLPPVVRCGEAAGATRPGALSEALPGGLPVFSAGNDQTAGAYGAAVHEDGALLITLGTAQTAYVSRETVPPPLGGSIRGPYPGGRGYRMAADGAGGAVVNRARALIAGCDDHETFFRLAASASPGANGCDFSADLPESAGAWTGIGYHTTAADMARAVLEELCDRMAAQVTRIGLDGHDGPVRVAGGGSRQQVWLDILADELDATLEPTDADPLLGAARMARDHVEGA